MTDSCSGVPSERELITVQRLIVSAKTGYAVQSPAVQTTADILLDLARIIGRLPPRYTGQVIVDYDRGAARLRQTQDVTPGIDTP